MKVALVNPPRQKSLFSDKQIKLCENKAVQISEEQTYPLEFGYISALLKNKDIEVKVADAHSLKWSYQKLIKFLKDFSPDFIGIPTENYINARCPIPFYPHVIKIIKLARENGIESKFIVWGPHGTTSPHKVLYDTDANLVVRGEPENTFVNAVLNFDNLKKIKGISYRDTSRIIDNEDAGPVDLNKLPLPDYASLNLKSYFHPIFKGKNFFGVMSSRGCPYSCIYCAKDINGPYRERKVENVIKELELLKENGVSCFTFPDEVFTLKKERTLEICKEMIERELNMQWMCQTRPELLDADLFKIMKVAGCHWIGIGFESGSNELLNRVNKKTDPESTKRCIKLGKKYGITVNLFTMSFLPGESKKTLEETMQFIKENQPDAISIAIATPIPGTKLWQEGIDTGILKNGDWEECLQKSGLIGVSEFTAEEIREYSSLFPSQIVIGNKKLMIYKIKNFIKNPVAGLHYLKKIIDLLKYNIKNA